MAQGAAQAAAECELLTLVHLRLPLDKPWQHIQRPRLIRGKILPRVLLSKEGDSVLCLNASGNSSASLYRAIKADDLWATR